MTTCMSQTSNPKTKEEAAGKSAKDRCRKSSHDDEWIGKSDGTVVCTTVDMFKLPRIVFASLVIGTRPSIR